MLEFATEFQKDSNKLAKIMKMRNLKLKLILGIMIIVIFFSIMMPFLESYTSDQQVTRSGSGSTPTATPTS